MGPKRRGRPSKKPEVVEAPVVVKGSSKSKTTKKAKTFAIKAIKIPVTERDEETVECDACDKEMTFREFRIHNLTEHYNIASTKDDTQKKDHRFYERCLKNMLRLKKVSVFNCPRPNCESKYKSTLGLAYHLEQCGRTREEIQADYIECEHCGKSYSFTTITWHRKTHTNKRAAEPIQSPLAKRASAKKASEKFKKLSEGDDIELIISAEHADDDFHPSGQEDGDDAETYDKQTSKAPELSPNDDISVYAHKAISSIPRMPPTETWERTSRILKDIFPNISINQLQPLSEFLDYLPTRHTSFQFKTAKRDIEPGNRARTDTTDYHRLRIFESEVTDSERTNNVINVGGPVSSMSWHISGKYLAVAVLKNLDSKPRVHDVDVHPTCIQFYENFYNPHEKEIGSGNGLSLKLVLGIRNGFIHCVQWSNYWPDLESSVVGHLAYSCGDGSIEIIYVEKSSFQAPPNVLPNEDAMQLVPIYQKSPEFRLMLNSALREESGQCVSFQWHEHLKYLAAGYASGLIAVFDVPTQSRLLRKSVVMDLKGDCTLEIQPIWSIRAHTSIVSAVTFASCRSRYLVSCSHDYYVKMWDLELRREMESKKIGMVLDACWIRGWMHLAVAAEYTNLNYQISNYNTTKFFQVGSAKGFANVPDHLNITCLSFHEGMIAHASELGRVTLTFYDQYLRECDYDRNKKKKNTIDFCCIEIDKDVPRKEVIEDPKLVITLEDHLRPAHHSIPEPTMDNYEDYIVYYPYVRANKISWCPNGKQLATGYHNGLVVVTPTLPAMFSHVVSKH